MELLQRRFSPFIQTLFEYFYIRSDARGQTNVFHKIEGFILHCDECEVIGDDGENIERSESPL